MSAPTENGKPPEGKARHPQRLVLAVYEPMCLSFLSARLVHVVEHLSRESRARTRGDTGPTSRYSPRGRP